MNNKIFFNENPYSLDDIKKSNLFIKILSNLNIKHFRRSKEYKKIFIHFRYNIKKITTLNELPFLPIKLFKNFDLLSVKKNYIVKIMHSSGTSGKRSKIFLDKKNSLDQIEALKKIFQFNFGNVRLPMIILSTNNMNKRNSIFDAKNAAYLGFSMFGKDHFFLLNDKGEIDYEGLNKFLKKYKNTKILIFGFTSDVYQQMLNKIETSKIKFKLNNSIILHGGGWKKLENKKISKKLFKEKLKEKFSISNVYNYYGLIEQTGSIFFECKCGFFISTNFSEVIIRDKNLNVITNYRKEGLIQLISVLPSSYPGHNILTEDVGKLIPRSKCSCNINGKRFVVKGRAQKAEIRGCSDAI